MATTGQLPNLPPTEDKGRRSSNKHPPPPTVGKRRRFSNKNPPPPLTIGFYALEEGDGCEPFPDVVVDLLAGIARSMIAPA